MSYLKRKLQTFIEDIKRVVVKLAHQKVKTEIPSKDALDQFKNYVTYKTMRNYAKHSRTVQNSAQSKTMPSTTLFKVKKCPKVDPKMR